MKNTIKKALGVALVTGALVGGIGNTASAANTTDKPYYFYFTADYQEQYTEARTKYDYTSAYMKLNTIGDGDATYEAEVVDSNGRSFSKRWTYWFNEYTAGKGTYLQNYAGEDRGTPVNVKIKGVRQYQPADASKWGAEGVWSPDSI
ncbi:TPA: hypothetical protein ROX88_002051 [Bacillus pseudomycoides]|nr:hypothetical protein [Bacillus pseudomycoides]